MMSITTCIIIGFSVWFWFRTLMQLTNPKYTNYDLDYFHHSDAAIVGMCVGMFTSIHWLTIAGVAFTVDDIIGHYRAAHGKSEIGPLEYMFWPLYKLYYKLIKK